MSDNQPIPTLVKELVDGVSTQVRALNRIWLLTLLVALLIVIPPPESNPDDNLRKLPFGLGTVEEGYFYPISCFLLSVLIMSFATSHAQVIRATKLAQRAVDQLRDSSALPSGMDLRDIFDILRIPSINRVAPLAQNLRGKYEFYDGKEQCPGWLLWISTWYYVILKLLSTSVSVFMPGGALGVAYSRYLKRSCEVSSNWVLKVFVTIFTIVATVAIVQTLLKEISYIRTVYAKIKR